FQQSGDEKEHEGRVPGHGRPSPEQSECPSQYVWYADVVLDYQKGRWH
ncbi:hypothetical protein A2U01_0102688, partial [Trifolium medium]|nr:hypothetical protein [Trifolium medium]